MMKSMAQRGAFVPPSTSARAVVNAVEGRRCVQNPRDFYVISDHMERPTSALHLTRVTLSLRQLGAEPHTKEAGRHEVYNHHCLRSARGHDGGGGVVTESTD